MSDWYYQRSNETCGPLSSGDLGYLIMRGKLSGGDKVREGATGPWRDLNTVQEFSQYIKPTSGADGSMGARPRQSRVAEPDSVAVSASRDDTSPAPKSVETNTVAASVAPRRTERDRAMRGVVLGTGLGTAVAIVILLVLLIVRLA